MENTWESPQIGADRSVRCFPGFSVCHVDLQASPTSVQRFDAWVATRASDTKAFPRIQGACQFVVADLVTAKQLHLQKPEPRPHPSSRGCPCTEPDLYGCWPNSSSISSLRPQPWSAMDTSDIFPRRFPAQSAFQAKIYALILSIQHMIQRGFTMNNW